VPGATPQATEAAAKRGDAERENAPPAEAVAGRAAEQDQRAEHQHVGIGHPLRALERCGKIGLDRRQRDIDDGGVDERHARSEDSRGQDPGLGVCGAAGSLRRGVDDTLVARSAPQTDHRQAGVRAARWILVLITEAILGRMGRLASERQGKGAAQRPS
jgi:hypothetical protein